MAKTISWLIIVCWLLLTVHYQYGKFLSHCRALERFEIQVRRLRGRNISGNIWDYHQPAWTPAWQPPIWKRNSTDSAPLMIPSNHFSLLFDELLTAHELDAAREVFVNEAVDITALDFLTDSLNPAASGLFQHGDFRQKYFKLIEQEAYTNPGASVRIERFLRAHEQARPFDPKDYSGPVTFGWFLADIGLHASCLQFLETAHTAITRSTDWKAYKYYEESLNQRANSVDTACKRLLNVLLHLSQEDMLVALRATDYAGMIETLYASNGRTMNDAISYETIYKVLPATVKAVLHRHAMYWPIYAELYALQSRLHGLAGEE